MIVTSRLLLGTLGLDLLGTGSLTGYAVSASVTRGSPSLAAIVATALAGLALAVMAVSLVVGAPSDGGAIAVRLRRAMALAATGLVLNSAGSLGVIAFGSEPLAVALLVGGDILSVVYLVLIPCSGRRSVHDGAASHSRLTTAENRSGSLFETGCRPAGRRSAG